MIFVCVLLLFLLSFGPCVCVFSRFCVFVLEAGGRVVVELCCCGVSCCFEFVVGVSFRVCCLCVRCECGFSLCSFSVVVGVFGIEVLCFVFVESC